MTLPDIAACEPLAAALARDAPEWQCARLEPLPDKGLAHAHVRLVGRAALARIPKQSQMGLAARANLDYQAACFERSSRCGHAPRLLGRLPPSDDLPWGALIVEEIVGRAATLPPDLSAVMVALARLHALPLPDAAARAPILHEADPLLALLAEIERQGRHLDGAVADGEVRRLVAAEIARFRVLCAQPERPPRSLISFDAHPGNFVVRGSDGVAVLVDLEKCRYAAPSLDLAHATLYTSTTWEPGGVALASAEVDAAYATWAGALGASAPAHAAWHLPLRRAMWLWSVTWCAQWRADSRAPARGAARGEDRSAERSAPALTAHVRERVDHYLSRECVAAVLEGFASFGRSFPGTVAS